MDSGWNSITGTIISIHAPVKGATAEQAVTMKNVDISIHAPVKGATFPRETGGKFIQ